jgi:hypothetical protein
LFSHPTECILKLSEKAAQGAIQKTGENMWGIKANMFGENKKYNIQIF